MKKYTFVLFLSLFLMLLSVRCLMAVPIEGDGILQEGEEFDYKIINVGDNPVSGPAQSRLIFSNTDPVGGTNPYPTTAVACQQYIMIKFIDNVDDTRIVLHTDNWVPGAITGAITQYTGRRTADTQLLDPDYFNATPDEETYVHPYNADNPAYPHAADFRDGGLGFRDGKKPIPVTGGLVGVYEEPDIDIGHPDPKDTYHDEVIPIVWQVYDYYKGESGNPYPASWYVYNYEGDPTKPDMSRPIQYRNPTDWWGFMVDKFALDWDWSVDWNPGPKDNPNPNYGHLKIDTGSGDPYHHNWLPTVGYRTVLEWDGDMGGFPGKRDLSTGYRLDADGDPMQLDNEGIPLPGQTPGVRQARYTEQLGPDGWYDYIYVVYIYLGANLYGKSAQPYMTNRLFLTRETIPDEGETSEVIEQRVITAIASYNPNKSLEVTIKPRTPSDYTDRLKFGIDPQGTVPPNAPVSCRQYLKIDAQSNMRNSKLVFYVDNTYNDASPQYTGRRTKNTSFTPTPAELSYTHPYPDLEHDLTEEEAAFGGGATFMSGKRPDTVTGGLVRWPTVEDPYDWGTNEVAPIVWQVYEEEKTGADYPEYTYSDPLSGSATQHWAFLVEKFSFDWDYAINWDTGHFMIDPNSDVINHWVPNVGYRTILDYWGNLGRFPGVWVGYEKQDESVVIEEYPRPPIYLYLGAHFKGKHAGTYKTERIILEFE